MCTFSALASSSRLSNVGEYISFMMLLIVDFEIPVIVESCLTEIFFSYMILFNNIFMEILLVKYKIIILVFCTSEGGSVMALIICPECGKEFSDKASACPNCGCPISEMNVSVDSSVKKSEDDLDSIWKTVPSKSAKSTAPVKPRVTSKVSAVKVDESNRMFQINGTVPSNGKKSGIIGKSFKGFMAVGTMGMSLAAEKLITGGKSKIGSNKWYPFSSLVSYDLLEDDSLVTSGGVGQALIGGAVFGGAGAIAGAITGKRTQKKKIESLYIKVTLNDFNTPCILIPLITKSIKTSSKEYQIAFEEAHKILSVLDVIAHNS